MAIEIDRGAAGVLLGLVGIAALSFTVGRASTPQGSCNATLLQRDAELILCEQRLALGPGPVL